MEKMKEDKVCNDKTVPTPDAQAKQNKKRKLDDAWILNDSLILKISDKDMILQGFELNDVHIHAAQTLLHQHSPTISGLRFNFDSNLSW